ncbi:murein biosynthesis integral membrane protein MurJ [Tepidibacillus sp. HK-1]|uniref:murein biosynthesis integral membrane protein MurJ n=1 Tax=Tepidibacillus sp. HK-1 TaxID=1883407 RepID=UPI000853AF54|nr:murein biosynthesis integral membrane protein MurJ [Tepidibacillus sp. HK-1]GBF12294.1 putative peptidoglycan biosynthesis protein MurJ [Tepidibacillus sp. HK-1]
MSQAKKILGATILLMGVTFLSKIIGFLREVFIAAEFGTSHQADIFVAVSTIPNLLLTITGGALSAALIPLIIRLRNQKETERLKKLVSSTFTLTSLVMIGLASLLFLFVEEFAGVYVMGFGEEAKNLTVEMIQIIIPALIAIGLISLFSSILNAYQHFLIPSLGPIFYSTGVIIATVFFAKSYGVKSLIIGMAIGIGLQFILALFVTIKKGISFQPRIWWNEDIKQVGKLILPIFIGIGAFQLNTIADRMLASTLPEGSLAALNYANRVTQLPLSLFVGSMVLPLFPMIADKISKQDIEGTKELLSRSYHLLGILLLPVIGVFVALAEPIISILFQRGQFDADAAQLTAIALAAYSFTILPFAMRDVITRALYSLQDTWTPVVNSVILVAINVALMVIFVPKLGMIAVAGSTSISSIIAYIRLRRKLVKKIGTLDVTQERKIWWKIWRNALIFTAITWGSYQGLLLIWSKPMGIELWLRTFVSLAIGGLLYIFLTFKMDTPEVDWLKTRAKKLLRKN